MSYAKRRTLQQFDLWSAADDDCIRWDSSQIARVEAPATGHCPGINGWVMRVGGLLSPIGTAMSQELLKGDYIQAV